jgi:hypothetical protein
MGAVPWLLPGRSPLRVAFLLRLFLVRHPEPRPVLRPEPRRAFRQAISPSALLGSSLSSVGLLRAFCSE